MSNALYIGLGVGLGVAAIAAIIFFSIKRKKKDKNPLVVRAENMVVMVNQRILSLNSRITNLDSEITELLIAKENEDSSMLKDDMSLENIPEVIDKNRTEIDTYIADIKDLQEYKNEIESFLKIKGEKDWKKLEELLEFVKEKFQYRYT